MRNRDRLGSAIPGIDPGNRKSKRQWVSLRFLPLDQKNFHGLCVAKWSFGLAKQLVANRLNQWFQFFGPRRTVLITFPGDGDLIRHLGPERVRARDEKAAPPDGYL